MTKILLADDSVTIQKVVELTFADEESEVTAVSDGAAALEKVQLQKPDIILSDVVMPGMSGYELCQYVKSDPNLKSIPFLFLKGTFESFDEEKARLCGADGFIVKPFESQELIDKVRELVSAAPAAAEAPPQEAVPEPEPEAPAPAAPAEPAPVERVPPAAAEPAPPPEVPVSPAAPAAQEPAAPPPPPIAEPAFPAADPFAAEQAGEKAAPVEESFDLSEEDLMEESVATPQAGIQDAPEAEAEQEEDLWSEVSLRDAESPLVEDKVLEDESFWGTPEEISEPDMGASAAGEDLLEEVAEPEDFGFGEAPAAPAEAAPAVETPLETADPFFTAPPEPPPAPPLVEFGEAEIAAPEPEPEAVPEAPPEPPPAPIQESPQVSASVTAAAAGTTAAPSPAELERAVSAKIEEAVRGILGPAVEKTAKKIVEEVAWEVIPELAEAMIKSEIERIKAENS